MQHLQKVWTDVLPALTDAIPSPGEDSGHALPCGTLECLRQLVTTLGLTEVFEFGSGRSTKLFLQCGCRVTSLEDSEYWLEQTRKEIAPEHLPRLTPRAQPFERVWSGCVPMKSWQLQPDTLAALQRAQFVLIDSPAYPPFREHALVQSLTHAINALVVLDDGNIPTQRRFSERLVRKNPQWRLFFTPKDHGLCFFARQDGASAVLDERRGMLETVKGWRRYWMHARGRKSGGTKTEYR